MTTTFAHPDTGRAYTFTADLQCCGMCKHWWQLANGRCLCSRDRHNVRYDGECPDWEPWVGAFPYAEPVEEAR